MLRMLHEPGDGFFLAWYDDAKRKGLRAPIGVLELASTWTAVP